MWRYMGRERCTKTRKANQNTSVTATLKNIFKKIKNKKMEIYGEMLFNIYS